MAHNNLLPSEQRKTKAQSFVDYYDKKSAKEKEDMFNYYYYTNNYDGMDSLDELDVSEVLIC